MAVMPLGLTPEQMVWVGLAMLAPCTIVCTALILRWTWEKIRWVIDNGLAYAVTHAGDPSRSRPHDHGPPPTAEDMDRSRRSE